MLQSIISCLSINPGYTYHFPEPISINGWVIMFPSHLTRKMEPQGPLDWLVNQKNGEDSHHPDFEGVGCDVEVNVLIARWTSFIDAWVTCGKNGENENHRFGQIFYLLFIDLLWKIKYTKMSINYLGKISFVNLPWNTVKQHSLVKPI